MKIEKKELLKALETVKPGLAVKEMIEQSTSFCFLGDKVVTYNDEISIACPIEGLELEGAVNAQELYSFVNKVTKTEIDLEITESEILLKAGRSKAGLTLKAEIVLPIEEIGKIKKWNKLPDNFKEGIKFVMGSCSRDMGRPVLTCVHANDQILESTDNYRVSNFALTEPMPVKAFLLPADTCAKLIRMDITEIAEGESWIHFKTKNKAVISCRVFEDAYPDTSSLMNIKGEEVSFPKEILDILDRAGVFSKREHSLDEIIAIKITGGKLYIHSESDSGWYNEYARIKHKGKDIEFKITPYLFRDILNETTTGFIEENRLSFQGKNWKYITMLKE